MCGVQQVFLTALKNLPFACSETAV